MDAGREPLPEPGRLLAFVSAEDDDVLAVVEFASRRVARRVVVGPGPHDLAVSPDGRSLWVTHGPGSGSLTIVLGTADRSACSPITWPSARRGRASG